MESISLWLCTAALFFLCSDCWMSYTGKSDPASIYSLYPQFFVSKWLAFWLPCSEEKCWCALSIYKLKFSSYCNQKEAKYLGCRSVLGILPCWFIHKPFGSNNRSQSDMNRLPGTPWIYCIFKKQVWNPVSPSSKAGVLFWRCYKKYSVSSWN